MTIMLPILAWIGRFTVNAFHHSTNKPIESTTIAHESGRHHSRLDQNPHAAAINPTVATNQSIPRALTTASLNPSLSDSSHELDVNFGDLIKRPTMDITPNT